MKKLLLFVLLIAAIPSFAQQKKWHPKDVEKLEDADIYLEITDYQSALELYIRLYERYGIESELDFKIGKCMYYLGDEIEAVPYFERSKESGNPNSCFYLAKLYHSQSLFDEAINHFNIYKNMKGKKEFDDDEADRLIQISKTAKTMTANPIQAMVYNLGETVNSQYDDYGPLIKSDEALMTFTSRRETSTGAKKDPYGKFLEDIYVVYKEEDSWSGLKNIGPPLNTETHDAAVGMSADGGSMIIYRTNAALTAGDLYITHFENGVWSEPSKLNEAINSDYQEASASLTNDERTIYFSSNRPGGLGGKDIYRVVRITDEIWSLPLNLGPTINTPYDEDAPFIHPDGKTLYFSSNGHKTMGGYDIFKTEMSGDYWSSPQNLGYPANTVGNDIFFVLTGDGKRGYYSTKLSDGYGGHDIYAVSFEDSFESLRVLKGKITNENGDALVAKLELSDKNGEKIGTYSSNSVTGNYVIIIPPNTDIEILVNSDGYSTTKDEYHYLGGTNIKEKIKNYTLAKSLEQ